MKKIFPYIILLIVLCLAGCGYHTLNWETCSHVGAGKTVNISIFANKTFKPNLEGVLASAIVDEFARRKGLEVVSSDGDLSLSGEVVSYGLTAVAYAADDSIKEYSADMTISATLRRNINRQVLWKGVLSWNQTYPANANIALQQNAEDAAIQEICRKVAQKLYVNIVSDF